MLEDKKIHILYIVGKMMRAGTETWLMHVLRHINRKRFQIDFLVQTSELCDYNNEIRALGSRVFPCLHHRQPWIFAYNFKNILNKYGPYDIIHSHITQYNGFIMKLAYSAGIPVRIAHSHLDISFSEGKAGFFKKRYSILMKYWINKYATTGLAASRIAAKTVFGDDWELDRRWKVFYCSIDLDPFYSSVRQSVIRTELGIPAEALVIGHVGKFREQKNHAFLIDIFSEIIKRDHNIRLLLVGDGNLYPEIKEKVRLMGLSNYVIFLGARSDIPRLMLGAIDIFLLPSFFEGLPLVLIEAQSAGLPCVISDVITEEMDIVKPLINRISLMQPADLWADAVFSVKSSNRPIGQKESLNMMANSPFNVNLSIKTLEDLYVCKVKKHEYC
ncbi:MAG: glycosyltransferase [Candidatus Omnitrophica bacterium]|nr:glycosyltransferase [Candidatus Omnitrophota bacterium]